jgi:hypothetical protein
MAAMQFFRDVILGFHFNEVMGVDRLHVEAVLFQILGIFGTTPAIGIFVEGR